MTEWKRRAVFAVVIAFMLAQGVIFGQAVEQTCTGAKFGAMMGTGSALVICPIFGPWACGGYGAIMLAYNLMIWAQSGC